MIKKEVKEREMNYLEKQYKISPFIILKLYEEERH